MEERLIQIDRCMSELEQARHDYQVNPQGALLSEMDWLEELHYRVHVVN